MRSLSTSPVILESNYTSELQSSFGIEIKPGKNHNRPGLIIYPSDGFLIAKLWFSHCWRSSLIIPGFSLLWESPWVSSVTLRTEHSRENKIIEIRKIFMFSYQPADHNSGNWILHNGCYILCRMLVMFRSICQTWVSSVFLSCPDCHENTNNYKFYSTTCCSTHRSKASCSFLDRIVIEIP